MHNVTHPCRIATVKRAGKVLELKFPYDQELIEKLRVQVPQEDRKFTEADRKWTLQATEASIQFVVDNLFQISDPDARKMSALLDDLDLRDMNRVERYKLSMALEAPEIPEVAKLMKLPARPFQWVPSHYARLSDCRFALFDEMGIGKRDRKSVV